jgi:Glycosyltransferase family 10 (fucosyltransferase) C-term
MGHESIVNLATTLFPESNTTFVGRRIDGPPVNFDDLRSDDVLLWYCGRHCPFYPKANMTTHFPGIILTVNMESFAGRCKLGPPRRGLHALDPIGLTVEGTGSGTFDGDAAVLRPFGSPITTTAAAPTTTTTTYFAALVLASKPKELRQLVYDPAARVRRHLHRSTRDRFLMYAASRCVPFREEAVQRLSRIGAVHAGGRCNGSLASPDGTTSAGLIDVEARRNEKWTGNARTFGRYRFVLAMENRAARGYNTEKIINAFQAGSIPIYYGTTEVFDVFNARAFVFYNVSDP